MKKFLTRSITKQISIMLLKTLNPKASGAPKHAEYAAIMVDISENKVISRMNIATGF